ncbi:MAG: glutathione S-transferase family protein [Pigmentiphaga sp.]
MKLYSTDHSPFAARVRMAARAKGIALDCVEPLEGPGSEAFRRISPLGMVPALELLDGSVLPESEVIVEYLEDVHPEPSLRPIDGADRARARLLARIADLYLAIPLRALFEDAKNQESETHSFGRTIPPVKNALILIDRYLGEGSYAVGARLSTADCALVPLLFFVERCAALFKRFDHSTPFGDLPRLERYWRAVAEDPHAAYILAEMEESQRRRALERARDGTNRIR